MSQAELSWDLVRQYFVQLNTMVKKKVKEEIKEKMGRFASSGRRHCFKWEVLRGQGCTNRARSAPALLCPQNKKCGITYNPKYC